MKKYVVMISENFPKKHPRSGEPTGFYEKIKNGIKIHTIRANYPLWERRFKEVDEGRAMLSLRYWAGKPYRSKQVELFKLNSLDGIGLEKIVEIDFTFLFGVKIEKRKYAGVPFETERVALNDGLSHEDFKDWFKGYDLKKPMALIHFTNYRY